MKINKNFLNLEENYLFSTVTTKVNNFIKSNPNCKVIRMGIGDVTNPLCDAVVNALHDATREMSKIETFHGYGPYQGYDFLRKDIQSYYRKRNVNLDLSEIFVSDGAKSDVSNILDLFDKDNLVLIPDPVYPVYVDTNVIDGRKIQYINANESNNFLPLPDEKINADIIYLCSPNNPTGAVYSSSQLKAWVDYAIDNEAIILFDAAYEAFIDDENLPHSIFEIDGAKKCAIEFCSFSKTAGFTGTRCGYTIIPIDLKFGGLLINKLWLRRQSTKFNGVAYIIQRGAQAVFSEEGQRQIKSTIEYYKDNARIIARTLSDLGIWFSGGENSPYVFLKCPDNMKSWDFFELLLTKANVVGTPGSGFGRNGETFFRLTAFNSKENTIEATERIKKIF